MNLKMLKSEKKDGEEGKVQFIVTLRIKFEDVEEEWMDGKTEGGKEQKEGTK